MKNSIRAAVCFVGLSIAPTAALAQANMAFHTVWGRLGAVAGDTGPAQAIPFATLQSNLLATLCSTVVPGAIPFYSASSGAWACSTATGPTDFVGIGDIVSLAVATPPQTPLPVLTIARNVNWPSINYDNIRDLSFITPTANGTAFNSFDTSAAATGSFNYVHLSSFQDRMSFNGSGTLTDMWGFYSSPLISSGTVTNRKGFYAQDIRGGATVANNYGLFVDPMVQGANNWGVYIDGTTPSFFGGNVTIGAAAPPSGTLRNMILNGGGAGSNAGSAVGGNASGGGLNWSIGNASAILGGSYDATTMLYSATAAYRFNGLTAGLGTLSSNGTFTSTPLGTGILTALGTNVGSAGAPVINGGALGSPSSIGTLPAFTLGGTIAGGGNQLNNIVIGTSTPLAGSFTTLSASTSLTSPLLIGGSAAASTLTLESTSGAGTTDAIVFATASQAERARITTAGRFNIGPNVAPDSLLTVNANTGATVAPGVAVQLHLVGADASTGGFQLDTFGGTGFIVAEYAGGTRASKTAALGGTNPFLIPSYTWDGSSYNPNSSIDFFTGPNTQSGSEHGGYIRFRTTPTASTALTESLRIQGSGGLSIGTIADSGVGTLILKKQTFASLTACSATIEGTMASITDSATATWGAAITGSSTNHVLGYCDGTSWKVAGI